MAAVDDLITENIDIWTAALKRKSSSGRGGGKKIELYGVKKLRELILDLAVRGLLVPQDPNDEPASVLLEQIAAERAELVKAKKIKKQKPLTAISKIDKPFNLPKGWEWCQFGNFLFNRDAERIPLSVDERKTRRGQYDYYGASGVIDSIDKFIFDTPLLLIGEDGANLINRSTPIAFIASGKYWVNNHAHVLDGLTLGVLEFTCLHVNAISLKPYVTGTAQPKMNQTKMNSIVLAIPPEKEQHRIVAKVDELMALCDQLEQQTESSITAHQTLVQTLLGALTQAAAQPNNPESATDAPTPFTQAWNRLAEHFDTVFTTEDSIEQLKQTILQLAVMGKLVPQDPNDEPASELLKRIAVEKDELVKAKKIKKQKALPEISEEEKLFVIPNAWVWRRLDDICHGITSGSTPPKAQFSNKPGIPYLKVYNIRNQSIDFAYRPQFVKDEYHKTKLNRSILYPGDVVMNIVGPPLGKTAIIPNQYPQWNCNQAITFFRPIVFEFNEFIYTYIKSRYFLDSIQLIGTAGQDNISVTKSRSIAMPIPPLDEQK